MQNATPIYRERGILPKRVRPVNSTGPLVRWHTLTGTDYVCLDGSYCRHAADAYRDPVGVIDLTVINLMLHG